MKNDRAMRLGQALGQGPFAAGTKPSLEDEEEPLL